MNCCERCESEQDRIAERAIAEAVVRSAAEIDKWCLSKYDLAANGVGEFMRHTAREVAQAIRVGFEAYHNGRDDGRDASLAIAERLGGGGE